MNNIKNFAIKNNIPIITDEALDFICNLINGESRFKILEIGSAIGYSSIKFCESNELVTVTTVERDEERYNNAVEFISKTNLKSRINIIHTDAFEYGDEEKYDLIFIDAAKAQYTKFFEKFKHNLNDDGVIICDNLDFHGHVKKDTVKSRNLRQLVRKIESFIKFLELNEEFDTDFYELGDGISVSRRK